MNSGKQQYGDEEKPNVSTPAEHGKPPEQPLTFQKEQRGVHVFISSTFRDMMQGREVLVKKAFPLLRKLRPERLVTFSEVDLRWGITDEQKAEGHVLPLCLPGSSGAGLISSAFSASVTAGCPRKELSRRNFFPTRPCSLSIKKAHKLPSLR
jgi:hypothetical protein